MKPKILLGFVESVAQMGQVVLFVLYLGCNYLVYYIFLNFGAIILKVFFLHKNHYVITQHYKRL